jgi:hypothetical protein
MPAPDVTKLPRIIGWGRPLGTSAPAPYCAVINADHCGSVLTACNGRWSAAEPWHFLLDRDRDRDGDGLKFRKCGGCDDLAKAQRTLDGLAELKHAPLIETRDFPLFDFSDVDTGDYLRPDLGGEA